MNFTKLRLHLRNVALLRVIVQFTRIAFSLAIIYAVLLRHSNFFLKRQIIFAHASSADICTIASLLDAHVRHNGPALVLHSSYLSKVFEVFSENRDCSFFPCSERYCLAIRRSAECIISIFHSTPFRYLNPCRKIIFGHIVMYPRLHQLVRRNEDGLPGGVSGMAALREIFSLPPEETFKKPSYGEGDIREVTQLFSGISNDIREIALISPICYSHPNIPGDTWAYIAAALRDSGYKVAFNMKRNALDPSNQENIAPSGFQTVNIPIHLLPLVGGGVGMVCGRTGGGFFMATCFSNVKRTLLIQLDSTFNEKSKRPDPPKSVSLLMFKKYGLSIDHYTELSKGHSGEEVYYKVVYAMNNSLNATETAPE